MTDAVISTSLLNDLTLITMTGQDATQFLQSQLTQDIHAATAEKAVLAGYCTARGRLLASMIVLPASSNPGDGWLLLTKADVAESLVQRLRMFVLRSKVQLEITTMPVTGVYIPEHAQANNENNGKIPAALPAFSIVHQDHGIWIAAPAWPGMPGMRWWVLGAMPAGTSFSDAPGQAWQVADIAAGLPWIQATTQDTFIPQTLNLDLIDGVSFTKGCYPGQEVVARSHYRGTIKRRMAYAQGAGITTEILPGTDTFNAHAPDNPCGRIINAAQDETGLHVLMEVQLGDLDTADFRIQAGDGHPVRISPLPYIITPEP